MHEVKEKQHNCTDVTLIQYTPTFTSGLPLLSFPATYDSVMKHKTHTAEASGTGKDRVADKTKSRNALKKMGS